MYLRDGTANPQHMSADDRREEVATIFRRRPLTSRAILV